MRSDRTILRRRNLRHRKALTRREYYCAKRTGSPTIASSTADPRPSRPGIGAMTKGRGVDIVIDSLAGEALRSTWEECLASLGRFMYRDWQERHHVSLGQLPMATFAKNLTFASVDLMAAFCAKYRPCLAWVVQLWVEEKIRVQQSLEIFDASRMEEVFLIDAKWQEQGQDGSSRSARRIWYR